MAQWVFLSEHPQHLFCGPPATWLLFRQVELQPEKKRGHLGLGLGRWTHFFVGAPAVVVPLSYPLLPAQVVLSFHISEVKSLVVTDLLAVHRPCWPCDAQHTCRSNLGPLSNTVAQLNSTYIICQQWICLNCHDWPDLRSFMRMALWGWHSMALCQVGYVLVRICCLSFGRIAQKSFDGFQWYLVGGSGMGQGKPHLILVRIQVKGWIKEYDIRGLFSGEVCTPEVLLVLVMCKWWPCRDKPQMSNRWWCYSKFRRNSPLGTVIASARINGSGLDTSVWTTVVDCAVYPPTLLSTNSLPGKKMTNSLQNFHCLHSYMQG